MIRVFLLNANHSHFKLLIDIIFKNFKGDFMKKNINILIFILNFFLLTACSPTTNTKKIVTTMFFQYDIASNIVHDKYELVLLTPFGSEAHGFEPTAKDILDIKNAELFLYTSSRLDPWVENLVDKPHNIINLQELVNTNEATKNISDHHYWTDPIVMISLIQEITLALINIDNDHHLFYQESSANYISEINQVFSEAISSTLPLEVAFAGHNALKAFAQRFEISIHSLSHDFKPDADLTAKQIEDLIIIIKQRNITHLFVEELVEPRAANTIKNELANEGFEIIILELHAYHNISIEQHHNGVRYVDLFRQNITNLRQSLN